MNVTEITDTTLTPTPAAVDALHREADADPAVKLARELRDATKAVTIEEFAAPVATL